jgi:mRNA interferase RelE/StbE
LSWKILIEKQAEKQIKKLDPFTRSKIINYIKNRIATSEDPRSLGKPLTGNLSGYWRYRIEDYRILCTINDYTITISIVRVAHRKDVYET